MERENFDSLLKRALQLAFFLHGDREIAVEIAASAIKKLEVATQAQDKRLYYTPGGRASSRVTRTKVNLGEPHLLQRLIYIESEPFEREKEKIGSSSEDDMITYFIKHLVKLTLKRNSFYVALGVSRLLHKYSTAETMEIYNLAVQNPDRVRDDYYYRSRKARLMAEMKERFGEAVHAVRLNRGEERFESHPMSGQYASLALDCLAQFTPWKSPCVVPQSFDPGKEIVADLLYDSKDPDGEHVIEVNRIHSIIHPDCYLRIVNALKYNAPSVCLDIPRFFLSEKAQRPPRDRGPSDWGEDETSAVRRRLDEESARRKSFSAGLLRILVDGVERARIDLTRAGEAEFEILSGAELLEVVGRDRKGEVVLATRLLDDRALQQGETAIRLEGGQEVRFSLTPSFDSLNEIDSTAVTVAYRETSPLRAASLAIRRLAVQAGGFLRGGERAAWLKPALAVAILALLSAGLWFFALRERTEAPQMVVDQGPAPVPVRPQEPTFQPQQELPKQANDLRKPDAADNRQKRGPRRGDPSTSGIARSSAGRNGEGVDPRNLPQPPDEVNGEGTRNAVPRITGAALAEVKTVALDLKGDGALCQQLGVRLTELLSAGHRVTLTKDGDRADAMLKISASREQEDQSRGVYLVRLANASGYVIWPLNHGGSGVRYTGEAEEAARRIVQDLLAGMQRAEGKK